MQQFRPAGTSREIRLKGKSLSIQNKKKRKILFVIEKTRRQFNQWICCLNKKTFILFYIFFERPRWRRPYESLYIPSGLFSSLSEKKEGMTDYACPESHQREPADPLQLLFKKSDRERERLERVIAFLSSLNTWPMDFWINTLCHNIYFCVYKHTRQQ